MDKNNEFQKLITFFEEFPGVGSRQAKRFALFLVSKNSSFIEEFTSVLKRAKELSHQCLSCMRYHFGNETLCGICTDTNRMNHILLVVEKEQDIEALERTHVYQGKYFILGKLISLISKEEIRLTRLLMLIGKIREQLLKHITENKTPEIILAFPTTPNGTFTDSYVREELRKEFPNITIKSLGRGFATGSDPEYADVDTLINALKNRS
jgi:recombination protein RecR